MSFKENTLSSRLNQLTLSSKDVAETDILKVYHFSREPTRMHVLFADKNKCFVDDEEMLQIYPHAFLNSDLPFNINPNQSVYALVCNKSAQCHEIDSYQCDLVHYNDPNLVYTVHLTNHSLTTTFHVRKEFPLCTIIDNPLISFNICAIDKRKYFVSRVLKNT